MSYAKMLKACAGVALLWAQPDLFFNQGALVYVQSGALVHVQGGMVTNDYIDNDNNNHDGVLENLGTIELVNKPDGWRGNFTIGTGAEVNSRPGSVIRLQGDYLNNDGSHRSTGTHNANNNTNLGGIVEFNGGDGPQTFRVYINDANALSQRWTLDTVVINNTSNDIADRYVLIANHTNNAPSNRDMWIAKRLSFSSGRIHTESSTLENNQPAEVRILSTATNAVARSVWPPNSDGNFDALLSGNDDQYVYGRLRWNVAAGNDYNFPVGGAPTGQNSRGIQGIRVQPSASHFLMVRFDPTVPEDNSFTASPYCRPGDPGSKRQYNLLSNGRWELIPYDSEDATTPSSPAGPTSITMYNRRVSPLNSIPSNGNCPNAGASTGLPGGADPHWTNYPTNLCFIGYNQTADGKGSLTPPNNCQGNNTGWAVTRGGFNSYSYNVNGTYFFSTVITHNAPLPSDDIKLAAAPDRTAIALTWEVTPEREHVLGYELYRSTDGINFSRIAQIDKRGVPIYRHRDEYVQPLVRYFYRVEQHDIFGNVRYSNTVEAMLSKDGESFSVQIYPQPVVNEGSLEVTVPADGILNFQLYDAAGKLVAKSEYSITAGSHRIDLTPVLSKVAVGNYNALVAFGSEVRSLRLIKADHIR